MPLSLLSLAATGCKPRQTPRVDTPKAVATEEKQQPATADTTAAPSPKGPQIKDITSRVTWGYRPANRTKNDVDIVVVHSNYHVVDQARQKFDFNVDGCIKQFRDGGTSTTISSPATAPFSRWSTRRMWPIMPARAPCPTAAASGSTHRR